jgi:hypothetical protein
LLLAVAFQWAYIGRLIDRRHEASRLPSPRGYTAGALGVLFALGPLIAGFTTNVGLIYKAVALAWSLLMVYHFTGSFETHERRHSSSACDEWMGLSGSTASACGNERSSTREVLMAARVDVERLIGTAFLVFGFATTSAGVLVLREWSAEGSGLATLGLLWTLSGFAMVVSAVWLILLLPLGRQRLPLFVGGGSILSGVLIMAGFLTHVIPCTGPA